MNNKKQIWEKLGIIIKPSFTSKWMASHVAVPFAEHLNKNILQYNKNPLKTSKNLATILVIVYTNSI